MEVFLVLKLVVHILLESARPASLGAMRKQKAEKPTTNIYERSEYFHKSYMLY